MLQRVMSKNSSAKAILPKGVLRENRASDRLVELTMNARDTDFVLFLAEGTLVSWILYTHLPAKILVC